MKLELGERLHLIDTKLQLLEDVMDLCDKVLQNCQGYELEKTIAAVCDDLNNVQNRLHIYIDLGDR